MKRSTVILIVLFNLFTFGIRLKFTFITFAEIFIALMLVKYIFVPIKIEKNSVLWSLFMILSWIPYFTNIGTIQPQDFLLSSLRLVFWILFTIFILPHIKTDIRLNEKQFHKVIINITTVISLILIFQYVAFYIGISTDIINLKILSPIMRSPEARMLTVVKGVEKIRPASIYIEPSFFALIASINIIYLLYTTDTLKDLNKCIFFIVAIIIANSFFGVVIAFLFLIVIYIKYPKNLKTQMLLAILMGIGVKFFPIDYITARITGKLYTGSTTFRLIQPLIHIKETLKYRPLLGLGWNNLSVLAFNDQNLIEEFWRTGHIIAYIFTSTGIIGFLIFVIIFINLIKQKKSKIFLITIIAGILLSTGDFLIPYFWYLLLVVSVIPNNIDLYRKIEKAKVEL